MRRSVLLPFISCTVLLAALGACIGADADSAAVVDAVAGRSARLCAISAASPTLDSVNAPPGARTGQLVAANQRSGSVTFVDLASATSSHLEVPAAQPHEVAVSDDGRWGVVADYGHQRRAGEPFDGHTLIVLDMQSHRVQRVIDVAPHSGVHGVAFVPGSNSRVLVTAQRSGTVVLVDIAAGTVIDGTPAHGVDSHLLVIARDGRTAFTVNEGDGTISRIDIEEGTHRASAHVGPPPVEGIALTPDGLSVWIGSKRDGMVHIVNAANGASLGRLGPFATPDRIAISPDGTRALISDWKCNQITIADAVHRQVLRTLPGISGGMAFTPDGRVVFVTRAGEREVVAVDLDRGVLVGRYPTQGEPDGVAWGPRVR